MSAERILLLELDAAEARAERAETERDETRWHQERCHRHHEESDKDLAALRATVERVRELGEKWRDESIGWSEKYYGNAILTALDGGETP